MKTPEEIKKGLEHCAGVNPCIYCPYSELSDFQYTCETELFKDALAYIQQLEANQPKWISVYDTLPKHKMKCIVRSKMGRTFTTWYNPEIYRFFPHFAKHNITHWMPLPEAPKED